MKPMETTVETCYANLDSLIGTEIFECVVTSETALCVQFKPPPPGEYSVEYLRQEFEKIESQFSGISLEIMRYLLTFPEGQASHTKLMENVWGKKAPTFGAFRQSVHRLNIALTVRNFGYIVRGNRKGIYRFVPIKK
jgi:hypothetical protein